MSGLFVNPYATGLALCHIPLQEEDPFASFRGEFGGFGTVGPKNSLS
jgi:hypothetical protein